MQLPAVITHDNAEPLYKALEIDPYFQNQAPHNRAAWYWTMVTLEVPLGELARDGLAMLALAGLSKPETAPITGREGFVAQGLEGKACIRKPLFNALMNLRDLIAPGRGRIVCD